MASIRRTDIMHNKVFSKGRPAKSERERNRKRQEAYRWRDARRIYLANSFDRWRKLRCSLGMKDSVLAWHLMEAHEKGQCGICRRNLDQDKAETVQEDQTFLPLFMKAVRKLCYSQFQFEECIKVVGLLCLEFDNSRKENFSLNETILAKFRHLNANHSITSQTHVMCDIGSSSKNIESSDKENSKLKSSCLPCDSVEIESHVLAVKEKEMPMIPLEPEQSINRSNTGQELPFQNRSNHKMQESGMDEELTVSKPCYLQPMTQVPEIENTHKKEYTASRPAPDSGSYIVESEAEVSLEIDVEKIDTSQEMEESFCQQNVVQPSENRTCNEGIEYTKENTCLSQATDLPTISKHVEQPPHISRSNVTRVEQLSATTEKGYSPSVPSSNELPLDMSLEKPDTINRGKENNLEDINVKTTHCAELCKELSVDTSYSELKVKESHVPVLADQPCVQTKRVSATPPKSSCRPKEEIHPSIPWQRRDMSRKEEYEFLELNPFSDLSEFSQRYPHVHQRTYYRWKRRIKEEYIILEQCPHMSFEQFSSVVLQAKESVFKLWKSFIAQGKGFFAPSDASKRLEAKCPTSKSVNTLSEQYTFLQKNLSCTQEQFCQKFVSTSADVFIALKRKVLQEFWVFYHNQHLDWKEFSKLVDISEEVHNCWRDHISRDIKSVMSCFSPNAQMVSPHYPTFQSADSQAHLMKANISTFDSPLEDSVSTSLSASYLSSVQNMMFPWNSYYGVHSPLNQQMLPMMLWPRMIGLNGSTSNSLTMPAAMSSSPSPCGTKSESPHKMEKGMNTSTSHSHLQPHTSLTDAKSLKAEKVRIYSQVRDTEEYDFLGVKRPSSLVLNENEISNESDQSKKQKVKEEIDTMNTHSPVSKSRKQNKQEYIYYLKNPSLNFKDLESLFPTISLRTFYRWRKEMNAALLFLQDKKGSDYQQFKLIFPDIPEDVFEIWRVKSGKENFAEKILTETELTQDVKCDEVKEMSERIEMLHRVDQYFDESENKEYSMSSETPPAKKQFRTAHVFVHQNPNVDFASFSQMFPNISARSFYRWKKEWKDAIELLQANPGIDYERYKCIDSSVTEEIFEAWKQFSCDIKPDLSRDNISHSVPSDHSNIISHQDQYSVKRLSSREFAYLQLHPQIEFQQFHEIFPYVPNNTFYQWKKEIHKIINYVRSQPSVCFEEISAVIPDITEEAFFTWKENIAIERPVTRTVEDTKLISTSHSENDYGKTDMHEDNAKLQKKDEAKARMTNALLHLMHNPNVEYQVFSQHFDFVSPETFELWLQRIKTVILHIASNPSLNFEEFRSAITDIGEDIFERWKSLTPEQISAIGHQSLTPEQISAIGHQRSSNKPYRDRALYFCQENPNMTYDEFSSHYLNISETDFKCWILKISTQISFIRDNQNLMYEDFSGIYPDIEKAIFDLWKMLSSRTETIPHFLEPLSDDENKSKDTTFNGCKTNGQNENIVLEDCNIDNSSFLKSSSNSTPSDRKIDREIPSTTDTYDKDQESSLTKLAKLAESNTSYYCGWNSKDIADVSFKDDVGTNVSHQPLSPSGEYAYECNQNNNNSDSDEFVGGYHNDYQSNESASLTFQRSVMSSPTSDGLHNKIDKSKEQYDSVPLAQENQSLSALMVMSADRHKFPPLSSSPKMDKNSETISHSFSNTGKWKYSPASNTKDEDEMFSSQRQKKMSRAEYLFVKDNPDVDSQEFARIFPGVSARTFYRWKKEIKAQMQIS